MPISTRVSYPIGPSGHQIFLRIDGMATVVTPTGEALTFDTEPSARDWALRGIGMPVWHGWLPAARPAA